MGFIFNGYVHSPHLLLPNLFFFFYWKVLSTNHLYKQIVFYLNSRDWISLLIGNIIPTLALRLLFESIIAICFFFLRINQRSDFFSMVKYVSTLRKKSFSIKNSCHYESHQSPLKLNFWILSRWSESYLLKRHRKGVRERERGMTNL